MSRWYLAFKWFKEQFCDVEGLAADALEISVYDFLTSMATKSNEGANGLFFLPYFAGAVTPNQDPNARGAYLGMTVGHTKADFIRATMEGVCFDLRDMLDAMVAGGAPPFEKVHLTGGIFRSELWCQIMCDILNRDCEVVAEEEATALGCAMNAAVGAGIYKDYKEAEAHMVKIRKVYHPRKDKIERYEEAFRAWRQIFTSLATGAFDKVVAFQDKYR